MCVKEMNVTKFQHTTNVFLMLKNCKTFILGDVPRRRAFALTEQSTTLMIIVHALNGWHTELAAISGARFVPPFSSGDICHTLLVDLLLLLLTIDDCVRLLNQASCMQLVCMQRHTGRSLCRASTGFMMIFAVAFLLKQCRHTFHKTAYHLEDAVHLCK